MTILQKALSLIALPVAEAQTKVYVNTGVQTTIPNIINGLVNVLFYLSTVVTLAIFLLGGFYMVASGGNEQVLGNGKKLMRYSLIGFSIIIGAWMILSTFVNFFLVPLG